MNEYITIKVCDTLRI